MTLQHPTDPANLYDAAERIGEFVASGEMSDESARHIIGLMVGDVQHEHPRALRMRLLWTVSDTLSDIRARQIQIDQQLIRRACRALLATDRKADADRLAALLLLDTR